MNTVIQYRIILFVVFSSIFGANIDNDKT